jgi:hypothetical protein
LWLEAVGAVKENPMTIENDILREQILALMKSPQLELPDYSADPIVRRRVGKVLSEISARGLSPIAHK